MLEQIILYTFFAATAVQLLFWGYFFSRLMFFPAPTCHPRSESGDGKKGNQKEDIGSNKNVGKATEQKKAFPVSEKKADLNPLADDCPPVSIIICAHNEAQNLATHLDRLINQNYHSFEVIVVTHNSYDESLNILTSLQHRFKHLKIIECNDRRVGKKFALAKGIQAATHEVLLLTDADCKPESNDWLQKMVADMKGQTEIILGFAPHEEAPGFLNKFIRYETVYTAMQYLSFALAGIPYMGIGRNMAYKKKLFLKAKGFKKHQHLASGDDDLFINEVAHSRNTTVQLDPTTFVYSKPKSTWAAYHRQKERHFSTGRHYQLIHRTLLFLLAMSHYLHYFLGSLIVILNFSIIFALLGYTVRMSVVMAFSSIILKRLRHQNLWPWVPALDAFLVLYYVLFTPAILMNSNTQRWN